MRALSTIIVLALFISAGQGEAHDSCASFVLPPWATTGDFVAAAPEVQESYARPRNNNIWPK
ncbi:MAG: hypothetical protein J6Y94_00585 [Bacteriovoracaceae bacterium]|nr:hypothetical protein [Bacteriovoracaceae bacterium]